MDDSMISSDGSGIEDSPEYVALSNFITEVTADDPFIEVLELEDTIQLRDLVGSLIAKLNGDSSPYKRNGRNGRADVFRILSLGMELLSKQNPEIASREALEELGRLKIENQDLKLKLDKCNSEQDNKVEIELLNQQIKELEQQKEDHDDEIEAQTISRIADRLSLSEPLDEDDLINTLTHKLGKKKELLSEIVSTFHLPGEIHTGNVINALLARIPSETSEQAPSKIEHTPTKIEDNEITESLRQELLQVSNDLVEAQAKIEELEKNLDKKENQLTRLRKERDTAKEEMEEALRTMKEQESMSMRKSEIEVQTAQIESMKTELAGSRRENQKLARKSEKQEKKLIDLEKTTTEMKQANEELVKENRDLKDEIALLKEEQREVIHTIRYTEHKEKDEDEANSQILTLFDDLAAQFEQQNEDLAEEARSRFTLITAVQKLSSMNQKLEGMLDDAEAKVRELSTQNQSLTYSIKAVEESEVNDKISQAFIDNLETVAEAASDKISEAVHDICHDASLSSSEKITDVMAFLIRQLSKSSGQSATGELISLKEQNKKLTTMVCSQLRFIEKLAHSGEMQSWIFSEDAYEDMRENLVSQCNRVQHFLEENAMGLIEDATFFENLMINASPIEIASNAAKIMDEYGSPETQEGKEMLVLLMQVMTANEVIRKYATEARDQCLHQSSEIRELKADLEMCRNDIEADYNERFRIVEESANEWKERAEASEQAKQTMLETLKAASLTGNSDLGTLMKAVQDLRGPITDEFTTEEEYVAKLEQKCTSVSEELTQCRKKHEELVAQTTEQLETIHTEMSKIQESSTRSINEKQSTIDKLKKELAEKISQIETQQEQINSANQAHQTLTEENEQMQRQFQQQQAEMKTQYDGIVNDLKAELKVIERGFAEAIRNSDSEVQALCAAMKKKQSKLRASIVESERKNEQIISEKDHQLADLKQKLDESKNTMDTDKATIQNLQKDLKETKAKLASMSVEHRILNTKLTSKEEKLKREKSLYDSQMKLKLFAIESDAQAKVDAFKNECTRKTHEFFTNICHQFKEMVDINQPIDQEHVEELLERVRDRLTALDRVAFLSEHAQMELKSVRQLIGAQKQMKTINVISDMMRNTKQQADEIQRLESENKSMKREVMEARAISGQDKSGKDWETWARKLHSLICDGFCGVQSAQEVRRAVEEALFAAVGNRSVIRRLDCLRAEKKLLTSGVLDVKKKAAPPTIHQVMSIVISVIRLQKMSGHVQSGFAMRKPAIEETPQPKRDATPARQSRAARTPLFSKFIVENNSDTFSFNKSV